MFTAHGRPSEKHPIVNVTSVQIKLYSPAKRIKKSEEIKNMYYKGNIKKMLLVFRMKNTKDEGTWESSQPSRS